MEWMKEGIERGVTETGRPERGVGRRRSTKERDSGHGQLTGIMMSCRI